ncbi:dihydrofolate reductase family protein [Stackebrandtia soli]|uniref:dihydrofolate reductase family protein n=1 Tax=Stackebrandtia soli TaxID=1892856 RepID=UPI0039ECC28F
MGIVTASLSISVDGYVGSADEGQWWPVHERLHQWVFDLRSWRARQGMDGGVDSVSSQIVEDEFANAGAYVMGRDMFDFGEEPWGDDPPFRAPVFVVTHRERETLRRQGGTTFTFVTDGVAAAIERARASAGDRDVRLSGGASVVRQAIAAGLLDELNLHQTPVLLGAGVRLWDDIGPQWREMEPTRAVAGDGVTHLTYRFTRDA